MVKGRGATIGRWLAGLWAQASLMLAAACLLATAVLVWTGLRAADDLRDRTTVVLEQAADQTLVLLVERLSREMRGAHLLIQPLGATDLDREHIDELTQSFAQGLATYAYVDAFFGWIDEPGEPRELLVVSRTDRPVALVSDAPVSGTAATPSAPAGTAARGGLEGGRVPRPSPESGPDRVAEGVDIGARGGAERAAADHDEADEEHDHGAVPAPPVRVTTEPALGRWLLEEVQETVPYRRGTRVYERTVRGHRYQFVVRHFFRSPQRDTLFGVIGYATDLDWVRSGYFGPILDDFSAPDAHRLNPIVAMAIRDDQGRTIAARGPALQAATSRSRTFRLAFLDAERLYIPSPGMAPIPHFQAVVSLVDRSASAAAVRFVADTHRILWVAACAILLTVILFVRLVQRQAELVSLRASFVSRVTHELKTPLSLMKLAVETLQLRRVTSPDQVLEYYDLLQKETTRLERLINSVLRFSQRDMPRRVPAFQPLDVRELVRETLARLETQLHELDFRVTVSLDDSLPKVWADAAAMEDVFDNLVQNAIKFSPHERVLTWTASHVDGYVEVHLTDRGVGIPADDGGRIFEPFVRGRDVTAPGHGLGLAIVRQVMTEHRGYVKVESPDEGGTTFIVGLPRAV